MWVEAGLAEMDLGVDHARQHVQAVAVDGFTGRSAGKPADRRDLAVADADVAHPRAVLVDDGAAGENQVEAVGHTRPVGGLALPLCGHYVSARELARLGT